MRRGISESCHYPLCRNRDTHTSDSCIILHSRCLTCGNRGHTKADCEIYDQDELRALFEEFAPYGRMTRRRLQRPECGYYAVLFEDRFFPSISARTVFPIPYQSLVLMPHPVARSVVAFFNAQVRLRLGVTDRFIPAGLVNRGAYFP